MYLIELINILFFIEAITKICAHGFVFGKNTYLRNGWNIMDFIILCTALAGDLFKPARLLRILRPLRMIKRLPRLRLYTEALISSMPNIFRVLGFLFFMIMLFAIIGLQLFNGELYYRCRTTEKPLPGASSWEIATDNDVLVCNKDPAYTQCPSGTFCGSPYDYGLDKTSDKVHENASLQFGIALYDNILDSALAVFQSLTFDGWTTNLFNLMDA